MSLQDDLVRSRLKFVPHGINSGLPGKRKINQSNSIMASEKLVKDANHQSHSTILVHEKKFSNLVDSITSEKSFLRQKAICIGKQSKPPEMAQAEKLYHECYSLPRLPYFVGDVEPMKTYTTNDSTSGAARSPFKFSQTTRHIMSTEKTDVDLYDKRQILRESMVSAKLQGKILSNILCLSPDFRFLIKGVKLQPLKSSTANEGKEIVRDVNVPVGLKKESSAETDTMDMDVYQQNHLPGVASSSSGKCLQGKSQTIRAADTSARVEMEGGPQNGEECDLNSLLDLPALAIPMGCTEISSRRTQSLDTERPIYDTEQLGTSKPSGCHDNPPRPEPSCRWAKRLKLSSSGSAHDTKSSKMEEALFHRKDNKLISKISKCGVTDSEPSLGRCHGMEQLELGQNAMLRNGESYYVDSKKSVQSVTLSHPWIRRWCRSRVVSPKKKLEAVVVCEPQDSKAPLDGLEKKQFPSFAAMALMGKAMRGFPPCEYGKRGPFVVCNTKRS